MTQKLEVRRLASLPRREAAFIEPMDCAPVSKLRDGPQWLYKTKLDGYRAIAVKADGHVNLFSRRRKSFDHHYPLIVEALAELPEGTLVDGEVVALDDSGRPDFNLLQNFRSEAQHVHYFVFDLLICQDRDLTRLPLSERRKLMKTHLTLHPGRVRIAEQFEASASDMLAAVRHPPAEFELDGPFATGSRGVTRLPGQEPLNWLIREVTPPNAATIEVSLDGAALLFEWRFVGLSDGRTRLIQRIVLQGEKANIYVSQVKAAFTANLSDGMNKLATAMANADPSRKSPD